MDGHDPFTEPVAELRAFLSGIEKEEEGLRAQLLALQDDKRKAQRAIDVLTDRKSSSAPKARRPTVWTPTEAHIDAVMKALNDGAQTVPQVAKRVAFSPSIVRNTIYYLRDVERIRVTGRVRAGRSQTKATTYALMPQAVNDAA